MLSRYRFGEFELHHHANAEKSFDKLHCQFKIEHESKMALGTYQGSQFLQVGLGNLNWVSVIEDGDIQNYPTAAYFSKNQRCKMVKEEDKLTIYSKLEAPMRNDTSRFVSQDFETEITFGGFEDHGKKVFVNSKAVGASDFDFLQTTFDSPRDEKIYGLGLQYTETDFKGKNVHVITSEGGVGRGLKPLTSMLNSQNKNQGGTTLTTYSPAYSFGTSMRRGFVFDNHTEIGNVDFSEDHSFNVLMW